MPSRFEAKCRVPFRSVETNTSAESVLIGGGSTRGSLHPSPWRTTNPVLKSCRVSSASVGLSELKYMGSPSGVTNGSTSRWRPVNATGTGGVQSSPSKRDSAIHRLARSDEPVLKYTVRPSGEKAVANSGAGPETAPIANTTGCSSVPASE